jgi:hypothetical protein
LTSLPDEWGCDWGFVFQGGDVIPRFIGKDVELVHVVLDHHVDRGNLLVDHRHHDDAGHERDDAQGRSH